MASLTKRQEKLLRYPPTEETWVCRTKRERDGATIVCETCNSRHMTRCLLCGTKKPAKPKLLWPEYLQACAKAKHTPGERWPVKAPPVEAPTESAPPRRKRG